MSQQLTNKSIIIFDGYCNLCSGLVRFLIKQDKKDNFRFVSLQSDRTRELLSPFNIPEKIDETVILLNENKIYLKSDAVLKIASIIGGVWIIFKPAQLIPKQIRDFIYDRIAKNRYRIFGKKQNCTIGMEDYNYKFLD
ncbi:MAG: thiol-disulfide oxidoreductase DCC family protein [Bacteroidales bacterium]